MRRPATASDHIPLTDPPEPERCTWCARPVESDEGFRAGERPGARRAVFCRLEHVVPWALKGARWEAGEPPGAGADLDACARCGEALGETSVVLVRHRDEHRIFDGFCTVTHLAEWAKRGGRYR